MRRGPSDAVADQVELLRRREELYRLLLSEADGLLAVIGEIGEEGLLLAETRRQELLESIQKIDSEIAACSSSRGGGPSGGAGKLTAEYTERRKILTEKILEKNSLVIALAGERMEAIRRELGGLARGRSALQGYEEGARGLAK